MSRSFRARDLEALREALNARADLEAAMRASDVVEVPIVTPEIWRSRCRGSIRCGMCGLCRLEARVAREATTAPWREGPAARPLDLPTWRWSHPDAALRALVASDDLGLGSASGSMLERARDGLGGSGGFSHAPVPAEIARATELAEVRVAFASSYDREIEGIEPRTCRGVLVAYVVGEPEPTARKLRKPGAIDTDRRPIAAEKLAVRLRIEPQVIHRVVRHGRRVMWIELAASGVVRMPPKRAGLHERIEAAANAARRKR